MRHRIENWRLPWIAVAAILAFAPAPRAEAQATIVPGTTITVNTVSDGFIIIPPWQPPPPTPCRLRDAIEAANTNTAVGGCPAGKRARLVSANPLKVEDVDQIVFDMGTGTPDIVLKNGLPPITEAVTIDGATGGATRVEISGENIWSFYGPVEGLVVTGTFATLKSLVVNGFSGSGIVLTAEDGDGVIIVTPARPERPDDISDPGDPCGPNAYPSDPSQCPPPGGFNDDVSSIGGPGGGSNTVVDCLVGTDAEGKNAVPNGTGLSDSAGIMVLTSGNLIGGEDPKLGNVISGNRGHGVVLQGRNSRLINNKIGTGISTSLGLGNDLDGVFVTGGQFAGATCEILGNVIFYNHDDGVDAGYNVCTILANRISSNDELGIDRAEDGVTANDPAGTIHRRPPNFPEIWRITMSLSPPRTTISGVIHQRSPHPITLDFFYGHSCDPTGNGEGSSYLGSTTVIGSPSATQPAAFTFSTNKIFLAGYYTATVTTDAERSPGGGQRLTVQGVPGLTTAGEL